MVDIHCHILPGMDDGADTMKRRQNGGICADGHARGWDTGKLRYD